MSERLTDAEINDLVDRLTSDLMPPVVVRHSRYQLALNAIRQLQQDLVVADDWANKNEGLLKAQDKLIDFLSLSARRYEALRAVLVDCASREDCGYEGQVYLASELDGNQDQMVVAEIPNAIRVEPILKVDEDFESLASGFDALADECIKRLGKDATS